MNLAIRFLVVGAAAALAGCVGYGYPGDYGSGGYQGGSYPGTAYPGNRYPDNNYSSTIRCESTNERTRHCNVNTRGGVRISRQLSNASCIQGRSWGYDGSGVWVSNGCRAEFVVGQGGARPGNRPGTRPGNGPGNAQTIRCESEKNRMRRCNVTVRQGVDVARQLSRTRCVQGQNWGWDRSGVWVRGGCRAEFRVR